MLLDSQNASWGRRNCYDVYSASVQALETVFISLAAMKNARNGCNWEDIVLWSVSESDKGKHLIFTYLHRPFTCIHMGAHTHMCVSVYITVILII